jgi:hypothetical protein
MERKPLPIGVDNFEKLVKQEYYYVDKTLLIKELIDNHAEVNLFTRPRGFGKSLHMTMLQRFFEVGRDNTTLFQGRKIMDAGEKYLSHMNRYPVIMLSLKAVLQNHFPSSYLLLRRELINEFLRHEYLLESDRLSEYSKHDYREILNKTASKEDYATCLLFLSKCLEQHFEEKVIILVDDYDVPMESVTDQEMASFRQVFFNSALKSNPSLHFAVMVGCRCVCGEELFVNLSNININSIISKQYGEYFGFTKEEVTELLHEYDLGYKLEIAASWYNGYLFGRENIFNPWSLLKYVADIRDDIKCSPTPYWFHQPANEVLQRLLKRCGPKERMEVEVLMLGGSITTPIYDGIIYEELEQSMESIWNYLFFTGYLKKCAAVIRERKRYYELAIPNEEVRCIFQNVIAKWMKGQIYSDNNVRLYTSIATGDRDKFESELNFWLRQTICYMNQQEYFYYEFLFGLLENMDGWLVRSNRDTIDGHNTLLLTRVMDRTIAAVMEVKGADSYRNLGTNCDLALKQIEDKNYEEELWDMGYETVFKYGIAFYKKDCAVKIR